MMDLPCSTLAPLGDNPCRDRICGILHAGTPPLVIYSSKYYLY